MPVFLFTIHAYRSWSEDHPKGFVQRDEGLQKSNRRLAQWRMQHAKNSPARVEGIAQEAILGVVENIATERAVRLHGAAVTPTHFHVLVSFRSPACTCGVAKFCRPACPARRFVETVIVRMKRKVGQTVAKLNGTCDRPWLSRGWDSTRVRDRPHFDYLLKTYFPKHVAEGGMVRRWE
ncbi:MAG TPA: hypothetical protein VHX86_11550 [Tepidisphaeraceae bacterium]|jgi:hypothetical protein|nr:hypothetical protein [Tepidisphaeraceae bacterium]